VGAAGDGVHRKWSPSSEQWCACGADGPLQRGGFLVRERRAIGCIESGAHPQSGGVHAVRTARFSGEGSWSGNSGRWGASKVEPVHRAVVCMRYGRPASAGRVPCAGTAGDGVHRKWSPSTERWCACGADGPPQRGGFLVRERRAMGCIESGARPQSRGAHAVWTARFSGEGSWSGNGGRWGASKVEPVLRAVVCMRCGRPASAGRVPRVGTVGDGVHRKWSPSTERWCACGTDGPLQRGGFLVWERRAIKSPAYGAASGEPDLDRGRSPRVTSPHSPAGANARQIPKIGKSQIANPQSAISCPSLRTSLSDYLAMGPVWRTTEHASRNTCLALESHLLTRSRFQRP